MKRSKLTVETIATFDNLSSAFKRAARASSDAATVARFANNLVAELAVLQHELLTDTLCLPPLRSFLIADPKRRVIHAPSFRERVLHHAVMAHVGPVLDRALAYDTYACRVGKGALAAVQRCQHHARRYPWYVQIDVSGYFAHIDHRVLLRLLAQRFKHPALLRLFERIVAQHAVQPGRGLPIGALTSQHFANYYLAGLDRLLLEHGAGLGKTAGGVRGMVRYMDDVVWWCESQDQARRSLDSVTTWLWDALGLEPKPGARVDRSTQGISFLGYRVFPGVRLLSRRRKRRYRERRAYWASAYVAGEIDARALQAAMASVVGITVHADARGWRRAEWQHHPPPQVLLAEQ